MTANEPTEARANPALRCFAGAALAALGIVVVIELSLIQLFQGRERVIPASIDRGGGPSRSTLVPPPGQSTVLAIPKLIDRIGRGIAGMHDPLAIAAAVSRLAIGPQSIILIGGCDRKGYRPGMGAEIVQFGLSGRHRGRPDPLPHAPCHTR